MTVNRTKGKSRHQPQISDILKAALAEQAKIPAQPADSAKPAAPATPAPKRGPMEISPRVVERSRRMNSGKPKTFAPPAELFKPYTPAPGVLPPDSRPVLAMDGALQGWAQESLNTAWNFNSTYGTAFAEGVAFLGYSYLSELTQRPEYRRISERIATEMTRKWIRLTIAGEADDDEDDAADDDADQDEDDDREPEGAQDADRPDPEDDESGDDEPGDSPDEEDRDEEPVVDPAKKARTAALRKKIKKIGDDMKRLDVRGKFKTIAEHDGWFGRAHLYIDTGDSKELEELKTDIGNGGDDISKAKFDGKKNFLRNLKVIEPIWCYPLSYNANDPLADDWYNPTIWFAMSKQIHVSRLLTFVGREVPDILKPAYAFGGLSMSQMAKPYVDNWLRTRQAVTNLIESFSVSGVYTNAQSLLQGGGEEVLERIELFNVTKSNANSMVLDKETEEFFNVSTPLGTLDALQAQSQEQMSSVSGIPLIVLLGITPTGLNASSEGELRVFYDMINAMQEHLFRDRLQRVLHFIQLNLFGEIDDAIGFEFEPLWSLDEKGRAEVRKIEAETHTVYIDNGAIAPEEVRTIEIENEDSPYNGLDPDDVPEPPAEEGLLSGKPGGGGEGGGGPRDNQEVDGAADSALAVDQALVVEVAPDVFAMDAGEFDESKHKRDSDGKFSTTGGGGGGEAEPAVEKVVKEFKTKKEHIGHLLTNGITPKELMAAMGWPSVSMPAQAKSLGMKLEKKDGKYYGIKMTPEELAAQKEADAQVKLSKKTEAAAPAILKKVEKTAAKPASNDPDLPMPVPKTFEEFVETMDVAQVKHPEFANNLMKWNPGWADQYTAKLKEAAENAEAEETFTKGMKEEEAAIAAKSKKAELPKPTAAELDKAKKATTLSLSLVPGEKPTLPGSPQSQGAETLIKAFNEKYAGKTLTDPQELAAKVNDFKAMAAGINELGKVETAKKAEIEKQVKAEAKKKADEAAAKAKEEAERAAQKNAKLMEGLGISKQQAEGVQALAKMLGSGSGDIIKDFQKYAKQAEALGYPITGFQCALIKNYSNGGYAAVNEQLRSGAWTPAQHAYVSMVNKALSGMPAHTGLLTRGTTLTPDQIAKYKEGHIIQENSFTSASTGSGFGGNVTFKITAIGKRGASIKKLSNHPSEDEVLFQARTFFKVNKVEETGGGHVIHMEEFEEH